RKRRRTNDGRARPPAPAGIMPTQPRAICPAYPDPPRGGENGGARGESRVLACGGVLGNGGWNEGPRGGGCAGVSRLCSTRTVGGGARLKCAPAKAGARRSHRTSSGGGTIFPPGDTLRP